VRKKKEELFMAKDPVCGMNVDENKAAGTVVHNGKTFYFCSPTCKESFEKAPEKYVDR
jgi:YHS domain-containing protein